MGLLQNFRRLRRAKLFYGALLVFSSVQLITYVNIGGFAASLSSAPSTDTIIYFKHPVSNWIYMARFWSFHSRNICVLFSVDLIIYTTYHQ